MRIKKSVMAFGVLLNIGVAILLSVVTGTDVNGISKAEAMSRATERRLELEATKRQVKAQGEGKAAPVVIKPKATVSTKTMVNTTKKPVTQAKSNRNVAPKKLEGKTNRDSSWNQNLGKRIESQVRQYAGEYSVYVEDLKSGKTYVYNNKPMVSASMIKVYILAKAYEEIALGRLSESETIVLRSSDKVGGAGNIQGMATGTKLSVKFLLRQMIIESDNVATNLMITRLGMSNINQYIQKQGYAETKLQRYMMDFNAQRAGRENYTSVKDLGKYFSALYRHSIVNKALDEKMLDTLKDQTDNDKIPKGLPYGTVFAHKTGELSGVYNDGGIAYTQKGDYVIVVMANRVGGEAIGRIGAISKVVYDAI